MEKNRHILKDASQRLQTYSPSESVWESIKAKIKEPILKTELPKLKSIDPPEQVWDSILDELALQEKINQLKEYTPGDEIWNQIDDRLNETKKRHSRLRFFRLTSWAAAAAILVLMGYFLIFQNTSSGNINYSTEIIEAGNVTSWQDEDTEILEVLREICTSNPLACESPEFREKEKELYYLNEQKAEILKNINAYEKGKDLEVMLTRIELEKNDLVKQMISEIL